MRLRSVLMGTANRPYFQVTSRKPDGTADDNSKYPVKLGMDDPLDESMAMRTQVVGADGKVPGMGQAIAGPEVFDYLARKKQAELLAGFEDWVYKNADLTSPEAQEYWYRILPWLKEKKIQTLQEQALIQERLGILQIEGPQTEEDMMLLYAYENDLINVSDKPLHKLNEDGAITSETEKGFQAGLLNPLAMFFANPKKSFMGVKGKALNTVGKPGLGVENRAVTTPMWGNILAKPSQDADGLLQGNAMSHIQQPFSVPRFFSGKT